MKFEKLTKEQYAWVGIRLVLGWTMIWAFFDKLFGLGYATASSKSWLNGGSPTSGYLQFASSGPLSDFYNGLSGKTSVDVIFMAALLLIGVAVILGIGTKISGYAGALLMVLLWSTVLPPANNPIVDDHIVYMILFLAMTLVKPGRWLGLGTWWSNTPLVKRFPILE
ncbi:MAG: DoxX family membrane protein [Candidatus Thermoplasmatota archaeon]|nr:DoxX family membrane protein [Candidatus Thermoplasmatota archaeon]